jgi:dienelactone hydrolase
MLKNILCIGLMVTISISSQAQKKVLSTDNFASWKHIENRQISNNGNFVSYEWNAQKGDGVLIIYDHTANKNDSIALGYDAQFSPNSDFIALKLKITEDSIRKLKLAKTKKEKMPKDSLLILNLNDKSRQAYPNLSSFQLAEEKSSWLAFLYEYIEPKANTLVNDSISNDSSTVAPQKKTKANKKAKIKDRKDLMVINPVSNQSFTFNRVEEYTLAKEGKTLAMLSKINDTAKVYALITFNTELLKTDTLIQDSMAFKKLTLDKAGQQLAFLASADTTKEKVYALYYCFLNKTAPTVIIDTLTPGMVKNWSPSENGSLYFSDDASKLFLGTAAKPKISKKDSVLAEEIPKLDVWSWMDKEIQPMQLKKLNKEKKRTYTGVYRIKEKKFLQLADTTIQSVRLINKNNGEWALGSNDLPYQRASSWSGKWLDDYYLINLKNGEKNAILSGKSQAHLSPNGNYTLWYELSDSSYYAVINKSGKQIALTKHLPVAFYNEQNDVPNDPYPYGIMGWAANDAYVFIYDRYDIWKIDPCGKQNAVNITQNWGRKNKCQLRYKKLESDEVFIPMHKAIILELFNESNNKAGYYQCDLNQAQYPEKLIDGDFMLGNLQKAKEANRVLWSTQTVSEFPEIKYSGLDFKDEIILSESNPQQKDFNWATTEIVSWVSFANDTLKGILYKPENFDVNKKYPMVVYFYERSSEDIHRHYIPSPSRSIINKTFYASNGYLVFVPDIVYSTGNPGQNAYDAIVSGVNFLTNKYAFINAQKIGLQGQSWGGYQTSYLITQTNMFAAAMAGAPVSNMTSAYGGIRWGNGMSRMFQYEHTQSRIGGTLWEKPLQYIENSPVFYAPKVNTPLLIMHNDNDGAVPWYQGIEYFMALRRLDKPVWLLNYNDMDHNLESKYWANRMDLSKRMMQFFNHYLKDEPAPEWIIKGLPAIKKGDELGY